MLNIALCDDDKDFSGMLARLVGIFFENKDTTVKIDSFSDGKLLAERYVKEEKPYDIVFLDIDMPGLNGRETARALRNLDSSFRLIFVSSFQNEVFNCFEYNLSDFIPKYMVADKLNKSLERILESIQINKPAYLFFNVKDKRNEIVTVKVLPDDILYFECIQKKVYLNLKKECFCLAKCTWKEIESRYGGSGFVQPHRGYLVQVKYIAAIMEDMIELDNGKLLPLGRRSKKTVERMLLHMID